MSFKWNFPITSILIAKGLDKDLNKKFAYAAYEAFEQYTPMDTGTLMRNVNITADSKSGHIEYKEFYAKRIYEGKTLGGTPINYNKDAHPLATDHWDIAAWNAYGPQITRALNRYRKGIVR